ncbi:MAG: hypothetical protein ACXAEU_09990 [Candidatus Hodarchaeales archaeon]|jgi:hypothetical protein
MEKEGWIRRFTVEEHRVSEYVEVYKKLGEDVRVESCIPDEKEACQVCFTNGDCNKYQTIYTRSKQDRRVTTTKRGI